MYAIYGNIYHQYTPVMLAYIPYMDPMGPMGYRYGVLRVSLHHFRQTRRIRQFRVGINDRFRRTEDLVKERSWDVLGLVTAPIP